MGMGIRGPPQRFYFDSVTSWFGSFRGDGVVRAIKVNPSDNTATVFGNIEVGDTVRIVSPSGELIQEVHALQQIPLGHKIALADLHIGDKALKYGEVFGLVTQRIMKGYWVHVHNTESAVLPGPKG
jgi:altronate dehydratase small subunit